MSPTQPSAAAAARPSATPLITGNPQERPVQHHPVVFTGSGSEYFRIWIVNMLLTLLTLGLYYPWARVRKLKYFYTNTQVDGHALDFHGEPKRMLRGFLLMGGLFLAYSVAGQLNPIAGSVAGLILAGLWPALLRASLVFRLANTSWRGLRFHFDGNLKQAYLVVLAPFVALMALAALIGIGAAIAKAQPLLGGALAVVGVLAVYALAPYGFYRLKAYQHGNLGYGQLQSTFRASFGQVLRVFLKTAGLSVLLIAGAAAIGGVLAAALGLGGEDEGSGLRKGAAAIVPVLVGLVLFMQVLLVPYFQSRMQNLLWTNTGSTQARFKSDLAFGALARRTLLNWVLMVLTLGLYWPFAAVATTRLRLQAITVCTKVDFDQLVAKLRATRPASFGDAAADLAGIDLGL